MEDISREISPSVDVLAWTPMSAAVFGPQFQSLSIREKGVVQKLHITWVIQLPTSYHDTYRVQSHAAPCERRL